MACRCVAVIIAVSLLSGCAASSSRTEPAWHADSALLFDTAPAWPSATDLAYDRSWPSTPGFYATPENVWYAERVIDLQGRWPLSTDYTLRRFDFVRHGRATR